MVDKGIRLKAKKVAFVAETDVEDLISGGEFLFFYDMM